MCRVKRENKVWWLGEWLNIEEEDDEEVSLLQDEEVNEEEVEDRPGRLSTRFDKYAGRTSSSNEASLIARSILRMALSEAPNSRDSKTWKAQTNNERLYKPLLQLIAANTRQDEPPSLWDCFCDLGASTST
ncbi:hypothetical protein Dimus_013817 [Dionaea muscipula]